MAVLPVSTPHVWDATRMSENAVVLKYTSPYGEEGFTGEMDVSGSLHLD